MQIDNCFLPKKAPFALRSYPYAIIYPLSFFHPSPNRGHHYSDRRHPDRSLHTHDANEVNGRIREQFRKSLIKIFPTIEYSLAN